MSVLVLRSTGDPAGMRVPRPLSDYSQTARVDHFEISGAGRSHGKEAEELLEVRERTE